MNFSPAPHSPYSPDAPRAHPPTHTLAEAKFAHGIGRRLFRRAMSCFQLNPVAVGRNANANALARSSARKITRGGGRGHEGAALRVCVALPSQIWLLCLVVSPFYLWHGLKSTMRPPPLERALWTAQKNENRRAPELPPQAFTT